ncbi:hypothetical protein LAZ67_6003482 [Cordylochernes scorpioides]|uniref:DDE-1 domain-containing protein n=1 Tax=Cordylochernes scorpioides TaxID=51811 RepID=A0ABY6KQM6_9ARAC|nr:hypothetical protein LAZ67_6003482 [Cordylochernes scorpioides]
MKNFVKAMDRNASGFDYLKQKCSSISDAKIKEGIFVGPQIRELLQEGNFPNSLNEVEAAAWNSFRNVCKNFLGSVKVENYRDIVNDLLLFYKALGCKMFLKIHFLHSHLDFFPDAGAVSDEHGERFHQDISSMEKRISQSGYGDLPYRDYSMAYDYVIWLKCCSIGSDDVNFNISSLRIDERDLLRIIKTQYLQEWKSNAAQDWLIMKKEVKRKVISLETKIEILDRLRKGDRVVDVEKSYSMNEATIRTIRTNENTIRKSVAAGNTTSMGTTSYTRNIAMEKMEQALILWIEDQTQKRVPIDTGAITNKALRIYEKKCEPASDDVDAAQEYPTNFAEIINDNSYTSDQASGHKAAKDRITILFCSNASGDYIMEPLVINKSKLPRAFKGVNINNIPVYWRANKKAWVTAAMFTEWFHKCFIPDAKKYLSSKGLPFKVLLLIENVPGHPQDLEYENVKVKFLPKNTTSLLQPLDQGIISTFKALYIKRSFTYILEQMENNESLTVIRAWKNSTMLDCVKDIALSYTAIKQTTLNSCWKKFWPNVVKNEHSISTLNEYSQIVQMAHSLGGEGFNDFTNGDIAELMADKELSEDDLINLVCESESDKSDEEELVPVTFTAKVIREGLALGRKLGNHFMQNDTTLKGLYDSNLT